jgi:hypothetical protein
MICSLFRSTHRRRQGYAPICPGIPNIFWPKFFFTRPNCPSPWNEMSEAANSYRSQRPSLQAPATNSHEPYLGDWRLGTGHRRRARARAKGRPATGKGKGRPATAGRRRPNHRRAPDRRPNHGEPARPLLSCLFCYSSPFRFRYLGI